MQDTTNYILYYKQKIESKEPGTATIEIHKPGDKTGLEDIDFGSLGRQFANNGWKINPSDTIRTIIPIITNEWANKPWSENSGIEELIESGEMFFYNGVTPSEMRDFYSSYLREV